jgi:glycerol transport system ATP-binding protein
MKWVLRSQLKQLHRRYGFTMVYVTHDQTEALTFADTVVVMYDGQIVQIGTPAELFERPRHTFVGYFIGSPGMNVLPVAVEGATARLGSQEIALPGAPKTATAGRLELGVRPEYVRLGTQGMPAAIRKVEDLGRHKVVRAEVEGNEIAVIVGEDDAIPADPKVRFDPAGINLYADSWRVEMGG